ncbi:RHS repeat domain-containing protein [Enterococcus sp. DIV0849a]|uniref:RHS repeat domain-containing protein n=1 Tax=unclassified Enterococcus TaxID=2608891 RepID=UPI001F5D2197|nr:RHS repeat domain-containing protein [Enterococcus sp. DIV0849a]
MNLSSIQYPNQGTTRYVYDNQNQVIETTNPTGAVTTFEYDTEGNLTKVTNDEGNTREYTYNEINKVTTVKDFDGTTITQEYNELGKVSAITNQSGHVTEMDYDLMWNIAKIKEPNGAETAYLYNQYNQLSQVTDAKGNSVHYDYDENQNVTSIRSPKGEETTFAYDALNRRTKMVEADGATTRYTYNKLGKVATITDALNHTTTFEYDLLGQLIRQTDALENEITLSYTSLGQLESVTDANGGVTSYDYYPGGNLKQVTYPAGETEQYVYDLNDNVIEKWTSEESKITYAYDSLDRVTAITNPLGNTRKFSYDAADRIVLYQDEAGAITEYDYSPTGNLTLVKDALGNETHYDYDTVGNLTTIQQYGLIDAELENVSEQNRVTQYQYDLLGNVTTVTDAFGNQEYYGYDENNQLIKKTDKDGYQTALSYNQTGQVQKLNYSDGKEVTMQYNPLRKLEAVKDWLGTTQMKLDALGRVEEVQTPDQQVTKYGWDGQSNRTKLVYPDGKEVQYVYNPSNKLTELHTDDQVYRYQYDAQGRLIEKSLPNQVTTHYEYTPAHQLSALIHQKEQEILEKYQYQYDQAGNKQVIEKHRQGLTEDSGQYQYQYDALQRLTHVSKDQEILRQYTYDAFGNRTSKQESTGSITYQYNALNQLIKQDTPQETKQFNYDQRGNLVEELINNQVTKSFTFDATNMMTQVTTASGDKATYRYNGLRNRTSQTVEKANEPLKQIQYILDLTRPYNNLLARQVNEDKEQYLWDNELLAKNEEEYFLLDDLGSPLRQLANTGQTIEEYGFDEFGQPLFGTTTSHPFGFTGYQQDEISRLSYAQARYYDQSQGRFVSEDTIKGIISVPETLNTYSYVWNSPLTLVDLDGNFPTWKDVTDGAKGVVDWVGDNVIGTTDKIVDKKTNTEMTEKSGGKFITIDSTNGSWSGISIDWGVIKVNTPIGDFGLTGTSSSIGWSSSGVTVNNSVGVEICSINPQIGTNVGVGKDISLGGKVNLDVGDYGIGMNGKGSMGLSGVKSEGNISSHDKNNTWQNGLYFDNFVWGVQWKNTAKISDNIKKIFEGKREVFDGRGLFGGALAVILAGFGLAALAPFIGAGGVVTAGAAALLALIAFLSGEEVSAEEITCLE